jgi:hypothetical protein
MAVIATLLAILAPALAVAPQPAAAQGPVLGQNVACGRVMQSPFDIIPIVRCDKSALFPNWMTQNASWLGQRPLYQVVLPGAHDALTGHYDKNVDGLQWAVQTQDLNVYGLLFYGVRAFDVRFCTPDTTTQVYYACHGGFYDEKVTPASVISDIRAFTALFPIRESSTPGFTLLQLLRRVPRHHHSAAVRPAEFLDSRLDAQRDLEPPEPAENHLALGRHLRSLLQHRPRGRDGQGPELDELQRRDLGQLC